VKRTPLWIVACMVMHSQVLVAAGQVMRDVAFDQYDKHSSNVELMERLLSPLTAERLRREVSRSGKVLADYAVDLANERYVLYVPSHVPVGGFGVIVFVPPWEDARVPPDWITPLEESGVILISAARSGNEESALGRREPLALLALDNIKYQYPVNPERVYVAGFSGGARVALRLALGYPDVFRGAILNAGSDPIGTREVPLPSRDLLHLFQLSTQLVYLTGDRDELHLADDMASQGSLRQWCVFNVYQHTLPLIGHEIASGSALRQALKDLRNSPRTDVQRLSACQSKIDLVLDEKFQHMLELTRNGRAVDADKALGEIDERYGGLAAPRSTDR
jgi:dienelactone hydrolase